MSEKEYLDKRKKFKKGNPGGGRPKKLNLKDFEPEADEMYRGLVDEACEIGEVESINELSPSVKGHLEGARIAWLQVCALRSLGKVDSNIQKMLDKFIARYCDCVNRAHDIVKKQQAIRKERGKGGDKPIGMY